jgi:hypothetical protein
MNVRLSTLIPGTQNCMEKDTEQERAEIREQLPESGRIEDDSDDPEGHEPLPGVVGNRIKQASEPERN